MTGLVLKTLVLLPQSLILFLYAFIASKDVAIIVVTNLKVKRNILLISKFVFLVAAFFGLLPSLVCLKETLSFPVLLSFNDIQSYDFFKKKEKFN